MVMVDGLNGYATVNKHSEIQTKREKSVPILEMDLLKKGDVCWMTPI
jgi:hypothetical protein